MRTLLDALRRDSRVGDPQSLLVLSARVPFALGDFANAALPGPRLMLAPGSWQSDSAWRAAGWGEAARCDTAGALRLPQLVQESAALFAQLEECRSAGCDELPLPRLYGGMHFAPLDSSSLLPLAEPWHPFPDASFALPRWLLLERQGRSYLQLTIRRAELQQTDRLHAELTGLEQAVAAAALQPLPEATAPIVEPELRQLSPFHWTAMVEAALAAIATGELAKVVVARRSLLTAAQPFALSATLQRLAGEYPECTRFAIERGGALFLGASPEKLVARSGRHLEADALAGSCLRRSHGGQLDVEADARAAQALLQDDKEQREHQHVVAGIGGELASVAELMKAPAPTIRSLRNVHHLYTPLSAELRAPLHVLELLSRLHPTPAVCGVPRAAAATWIATHEPAPRGLYAAPIGWFDASGDGAFYVAIRSAVVAANRAWLYAGAGVVAGSDPAREYHETAAKQRVMLSALGLLR